jgi:hypothetical protein
VFIRRSCIKIGRPPEGAPTQLSDVCGSHGLACLTLSHTTYEPGTGAARSPAGNMNDTEAFWQPPGGLNHPDFHVLDRRISATRTCLARCMLFVRWIATLVCGPTGI